MNNSGTAVGCAEKYDGDRYLGPRAVRWDLSGTAATELGNPGTHNGETRAEACAINGAGIAIGYADKYDESGTDLGRNLLWDGKARKFANSDEANALLNPPYREGWSL